MPGMWWRKFIWESWVWNLHQTSNHNKNQTTFLPHKEQVKKQDIIMLKSRKYNQLNFGYEEKYISSKNAWNIICITNKK